MSESLQPTAVGGLAIEAVEWLPSGTDSGLVRVRGRWAEAAARPVELPALCVRVGGEVRRFGSLPDVRFGRDPALWRGSYLVPAVLVERGPEALWLVLADGREVRLPALEGEAAPERAPAEPPGGAVIDRAVLAEKRARRAEDAERKEARRAAEALQAVEALERRSAELERRLEAPPAEPAPEPEATRAALETAVASLARLRSALHDQRLRLRSSELQRAADGVALVALRDELADVAALRAMLHERAEALEAATARAQAAEAVVRAAREQAAEQVAAASRRAALDAAAVRERAATELRAAEEAATAARAAEHSARAELAAVAEALAGERAAHRATRDRVEAREAELRELAAALEGARAELEGARTESEARERALDGRIASLEEALAGQRERLTALGTELATARAALVAATAERRAELVARAALEAQLERERAPAAEPPAEAGRPVAEGLQARIARIERTASVADLERHAAEQSVAAAAVERAAPSAGLAADLDAAAAALRARDVPPVAEQSATRPWLRGALARLARDDPETAARLLLALAPALRAVAALPLDCDLTIRGAGTYAITIGDPARTVVRRLGRPRGRREAAFHVTADGSTLAEVVAGVHKRIGRWQGSVRVSGRRGDAVALAEALRASRLSLGAALAAGADLPPDLVFALFPYVVEPAWTRGHRFTVAQEIIDVPGAAFVIAARDGEPLTVSRTPPAGGADATVSMTRAAFEALLRGAPASGERRPVVRGNRAAVAALKAWTDRAQGIAR